MSTSYKTNYLLGTDTFAIGNKQGVGTFFFGVYHCKDPWRHCVYIVKNILNSNLLLLNNSYKMSIKLCENYQLISSKKGAFESNADSVGPDQTAVLCCPQQNHRLDTAEYSDAQWKYTCVFHMCVFGLTYSTFRITKTYLYNFDPLKPHFYIVKLGFTGVYIIFLISAQKHRLWVLVRTASSRRF